MKVRVIRYYEQPYPDPISVRAGACLFPDFNRETDIEGWVWCTGEDGRGGWTPRAWLRREGMVWRIDRDFNALELSISPGELLEVLEKESGFYRVARPGGETGWVPCENVERLSG